MCVLVNDLPVGDQHKLENNKTFILEDAGVWLSIGLYLVSFLYPDTVSSVIDSLYVSTA